MSTLLLLAVLGCLAGTFFTTKFLVVMSIVVFGVIAYIAIPSWQKELAHLWAIWTLARGFAFLLPAWLVWFFVNGPSTVLPSIRDFILR